MLTIGGGGSHSFGFAVGVVHGLLAEGIDLRGVPIVGTSGGSHAAVAIAANVSFDDVDPVWREFVGSAKSFWTRAADLTEPLYGKLEVTDVAGVAVRLLGFRRVLLWAPDVRPADLVAASSSPFPFARPHKIGKRRYIDGGHRSGTSADLVPPADLQLVLASLSHRSQGFLGRMGARQVAKETRKWEEAHGGRTLVVGPTATMCEIKIKGMRTMADMAVGRQIHDLAVPLGRETAAILRRDHPDVVERLGAGELQEARPEPTLDLPTGEETTSVRRWPSTGRGAGA